MQPPKFAAFLSKIWVASLHYVCLCKVYPIWYIQSLILTLCAVLVLCHINHIGDSTSIFRNHNLESFCISAWLPIFLQCIMLAHQEALQIQISTLIEVMNNIWKPYWLNESKYLWNVLMCLFVFGHSEIECGVESTHENHLIILLDSPFNPSKSWLNYIEDLEPLLRHILHDARVHAPSRANFIKRALLCLKFCTEARDSVLKPAHTKAAADQAPKSDPSDCLDFLAKPLQPLQTRRAIFSWILLILKNWS